MSNYDNPFDAGDNNPFSDTPAAGRGRAAPAPAYSNLGGQYATGSFYDNASGVAPAKPSPLPHEGVNSAAIDVNDDIPLGNSSRELKRKQRELEAKEKALKKKEEELRKREAAVGMDHKNWPPFFPILHHDIANDIPSHLQYLQRAAYWTWLGIMWCLLYNIIAVVAAWISGAVGGAKGFGNFFLALAYALLGWPLSYFLWYRRLYNAMRRDGAISFAIFFIFYLVHCLFVIFASIAPPFLFKGKSLTGVYSAIDVFSDGKLGVGIMYSIGAGFFILESLLSVYVLQQVYMYFRGQGKANSMRGEVAMGAVSRY